MQTQAQAQQAVEAVTGKLEWATGSRLMLAAGNGKFEPVSEVKARITPEQYKAVAEAGDKLKGYSVSLFRKRVRVVAAQPPAPKPKPKPKSKGKAAKKATAGNNEAKS